MNYLIVGDYKFLGRKLGERLCKDNKVVCLGPHVDGTVSDIGEGIVSDVSSDYALRNTCSKHDIDALVFFQEKIYNEVFGYDPITEYKMYSAAVAAIASMLTTHNIKHVYFRSSYETYGVSPNTQKSPLSESVVGQPITYRGASLRSFEDYLRIHCFNEGVKFTSFRLFEVFGQDNNMVSEWLIPYVLKTVSEGKTAAVSCGEVWKDFIHEDDALEAIHAVIRAGYVGPINIGSGRPVKVKRVLSRIKKFSNDKNCIISVDSDKVPALTHVANIEKMSQFYIPSIKWEDRIEQLVESYKGE